jgi:hypothetical protein
MPQRSENLWQAAVREAGHAIIAGVLGVSCGEATLVPDSEREPAGAAHLCESLEGPGRGRIPTQHDCADQTFLDDNIIVAMAGAEAEREIIGSYASNGLLRDSLGYSDLSPIRATQLRRVARQLVKKHRTRIRSFAQQLIALNELDEFLSR